MLYRSLVMVLITLAMRCAAQEPVIPLGPGRSAEQQTLLAQAFRLTPYLQSPRSDGMVVLWFSHRSTAGTLRLTLPDGGTRSWTSEPTPATALAWAPGELPPILPVPFRHEIRLDGLEPNTRYPYTVTQDDVCGGATLVTAPGPDQPVRIAAFGDAETEPESTGVAVDWPDPQESAAKRRYVRDQTDGMAANLKAVAAAQPQLLLIAGDLVETGGEQRDWEEFWRHFAPLAATVPLVPALGNHDYAGGRLTGGYRGYMAAANRFLTYFVAPDNGAANPLHRGRYFRLDYGPLCLLVLDTNNGDDTDPLRDTNHYLTTTDVPDFNPGSDQANWLGDQLDAARRQSRWRMVMCHHTPWSVGYHGRPPEVDPLSGVPLRALLPMLQAYGVTAMLAGHDEMYEHSVIPGQEVTATGESRPHELHLYDIGIAGDGLRGPQPGAENPYQRFLAHTDSPETWRDGKLVAGGKNYGFLIIDIQPDRAEFTPHYVLPDGTVKTYNDHLVITRP